MQFSFNESIGYVSESFSGGVTIQCVFSGTGKRVLFIDSRLSDDLPWILLRSIIVGVQDIFSIPEKAEGQQFRIRSGVEPVSMIAATGAPGSGSGGSGSGGRVTSEDIEQGAVNLEHLSDEVKDQLAGNTLTDDDLENIYFEPNVTSITGEDVEGGFVLTAEAENIDDDEAVTWDIDTDGQVTEIEDTGTSLTLSEQLSAAVRNAQSSKVRLHCSDYVSEWFDILGTEGSSEENHEQGD